MATTLTTPETRPDITHHAITRLTFEVPHTLDQGNIIIDRDRVVARYRVVYYNADGVAIDRFDETVFYADWPAGVKTDMQSVYAAVETDAKNKGLIDPGADEPL